MFRSFIALTLTASLAITGFTTPAKAGNDDLTKALIGLAVIAGVAVAIDNRNDRRDARRTARREAEEQSARMVLPRRCLKRFDTGRQIKYGFGVGCLNNRAARVSPPEHCARRGVNPRGRWTTFYPERCMAREGFTVASR